MTEASHTIHRHRDRESIIEVTLVDIQPFLDEAYAELKEAGKLEDDVIGVGVWSDDLGYVETTQGLFFLNYEAIPAGNDDSPLTSHGNHHLLPIYYRREKSIAMFPNGEFKVTREFVLGLPTKEKVSFAKWVKTFGHRLEGNFRNWNEFLTPIYVAAEG